MGNCKTIDQFLNRFVNAHNFTFNFWVEPVASLLVKRNGDTTEVISPSSKLTLSKQM